MDIMDTGGRRLHRESSDSRELSRAVTRDHVLLSLIVPDAQEHLLILRVAHKMA